MQKQMFGLGIFYMEQSGNPAQRVCVTFSHSYSTGIQESTYMELSKLPTLPAVSPGVGLWKQGLLMLQIMP